MIGAQTSSDGLQPEEQDAIRIVANLMTRDHTASGEHMIYGALYEACIHPARAGVSARHAWVKSLVALGETCVALAKREKDKYGK